jgi:DNA polymerase III delta subunit
MAKNPENKYLITYSELKKIFDGKNIPNNLLLFISEKILFKELLNTLGQSFIGKEFNEKIHSKLFYSDDKNIEDVINECSNLGFFSEKKIVIFKIIKRTGVKGIAKEDKSALLQYLQKFNPDTLLILLVQDKEFTFSNFEEFGGNNIEIFYTGLNSEKEIFDWVKIKFEGFKISDETIYHFLKFLNPSIDEILSEIEKLKTFCSVDNIITNDIVNLCIGISKDFKEDEFIEAVFSRDMDKALNIYDSMSLKEDVEIYFLVLLNSAFIGITKLFDPKINEIYGYNLKRELRIWNNDEKRLSIYKKYGSVTNELKIIKAFDYIYKADKAFKTSASDKRAVFTTLIKNLTDL